MILPNIITGPGLLTSTTSATFVFGGVQGANSVNSASAEAITSFQCQLDGSAFAPCTSPKSYTGLSNGEHSFRVLASDGKGNIDPTPALYVWTIGSAPTPVDNTQKIFLPIISRGGSAVEAANWEVKSESVDSEAVISESAPLEEGAKVNLFLPLVVGGGE